MDYKSSQFVTGVISVGLKIQQVWHETKEIGDIRNKVSAFIVFATSEEIIKEGIQLEELLSLSEIDSLKTRIEICWNDFIEEIRDPLLTPGQMEQFLSGLTESISREVEIIKRFHGLLPNSTMQIWWDGYNEKRICDKSI